MNKWDMVRLGDIFKITSGGTPSKSIPEYYKNGKVLWIRTGDLKDKYITKAECLITEEALKNSSAKLFPINTVLIAMYGATIGACSILAVEAATNQACAALLPNENVDSSYIYYFIYSMKNEFVSMGVGGAQPNISATILKNIKIPLPPLETQKQIAKTLDTAAELLTIRKQQLVELDNLIKSTFYDMFGDPVKKADSNEMFLLGELTNRIVVGYVGEAKDEYCEQGVPYLRTQNVRIMNIDFNNLIYINENFHKRLRKSQIHPGDVVLSRVGVNRGMAAVIPNSLHDANIANAIIIGKSDNFNSTYLAFYLNATVGKHPRFGYSVGSAQGVINTSIVKQWPIIIAPLTIQNKFADIVIKIEEQKALVKKAIDETQYLFDSLMSEYFE